MGPPYTANQLIKRVHLQVKKTGLFSTAVGEWEGFAEPNKTWPKWNSYMIKTYNRRETLGFTAGQGGYHWTANVVE